MISAAGFLDEAGFAISAGAAQIATNLDNLLLLLALAPGLGAGRAALAYLAAQTLVLSAALIAGAALASLAAGWIWMLGLVPISLGLRAILGRGGSAAPTRGSGTLAGAVLAFLALGADTLAIFTPILADSLPRYRVAALTGAVLASLLAISAVLLFQARAARLTAWAERAVPWVMIAAGVYVMLDSGTDAVQ